MPWRTRADVARHNKAAAKSPRKRKVWRKVANKLKAEGKDDATAIEEANAVAKRMYGGKK